MEQTFNFNPRFDSVEWINLGDILRVTFEDDHGMDAFALAHSYRTDEKQWMNVWEAPEFSGPVDIEFEEELADYADSYPTRDFTLIGFNGTIGFFYVVDEIVTQAEFEVPKRIASSEYFDDVTATTTRSEHEEGRADEESDKPTGEGLNMAFRDRTPDYPL